MRKSILSLVAAGLSLVVGAEANGFRHYRFKVEKVGPNPQGGQECMQFSRLRLYDGAVDVTDRSVGWSHGTRRIVCGQEPYVVLDPGVTDPKAKWCDRSPQFGEVSNLWLRVDYPTAQRVTSYAWWTANDAVSACHWRDPVSWRLQGSDDGRAWLDLDVRADYDVPTNRNFRVGPFGCPPPVAAAVDAVDPFIGSGTDLLDRPGYGGMCHPGARVPFGLTQIVADSPVRDSADYQYWHPVTEGFACTRLSGVGYYGDFGNFLVRPTVGLRNTFGNRAETSFAHKSEVAEPGYYSTFLGRWCIRAETTATRHGGMMRFTYPATQEAIVAIDLARRIALRQSVSVHSRQKAWLAAPNVLEGEMFYSERDGGWGRGEGRSSYPMFFRCESSRPFDDVLFYEGGTACPGARELAGSNVVFTTRWSTAGDDPVTLKFAFSYANVEGARRNLAADFPEGGFDFDGTRRRAKEAWRKALDVMKVEGGTPRDRAVFASCLFFALQDPRDVSDVDGHYPVGGKVACSTNFAYRTVFSGWDVFRSEMPLLSLICPRDVSDTVNSLMATMEGNNRAWLPVWDIFGCNSSCMLGNPAIPVILDAYVRGIRTFDAAKALEMCRSTMKVRGNGSRGYVPWAMSETLEYAYNDWCVGRLAELLERPEVAQTHYAAALNYTNCWDRSVGWMRSRARDGGWMQWKGLLVFNQGTTESNPNQQGWFVPHDPYALIKLVGGDEKFTARLDKFIADAPGSFTSNPYYNHSNEPVHLAPFLFHYAGRPDLTQKWTRRICANAYDIGPRGFCGAEDEGQMSAWYVLCAAGLHPACPGDGVWMITSPVFDRITIQLDPRYYAGGTFTVLAKNNSPKNVYIRAAKLNGTPLDRLWLRVEEVTNGGVLELEMSDAAPKRDWRRPPNPMARSVRERARRISE